MPVRATESHMRKVHNPKSTFRVRVFRTRQSEIVRPNYKIFTSFRSFSISLLAASSGSASIMTVFFLRSGKKKSQVFDL